MNTDAWPDSITRQWFWMLGGLIAAVVLAGVLGIFWRLDLSMYDAALPSAPAPADVVIIAVDDPSIAALGRWPWPRAVHAALLDRLRAAGARAVALDFLFTEPETGAPGETPRSPPPCRADHRRCCRRSRTCR